MPFVEEQDFFPQIHQKPEPYMYPIALPTLISRRILGGRCNWATAGGRSPAFSDWGVVWPPRAAAPAGVVWPRRAAAPAGIKQSELSAFASDVNFF